MTAPQESTPAQSQEQTTEDWELVRRSVAMLPTGAWAMKREQSLHALTTLIKHLKRGTSPG